MKRTALTVVLLLLVFALIPAQTAHALAFGQEDVDRHPYVGLVTDSHSSCAATAIAPLVLVTSADCFSTDGLTVSVSLGAETGIQKPGWVTGVWIVPDGTCLDCKDQNGVGIAVVILDSPVELHEYAQLPSLQSLTYDPGQAAEVVGYRLNPVDKEVAQLPLQFARQFSFVNVIANKPNQNSDTFQVEAQRASDTTCFTATGGPVLAEKSITLLGVIAAGDPQSCRKTVSAYGLRSSSVLAFLQEALDDPMGLKVRHDLKTRHE